MSELKLKKLKMQTPNICEENIKKLKELFPQIVSEDKIDFDILKQLLSNSIVEADDERYRLDWVGKKRSLLKANTPINKTLRPCVEESVDFENTKNLYIEGDNFEVLKLLQESYLNKIKMIYIDPPYNTGKDFVYRDNFTQKKDEFEDEIGLRDEEGNKLFKNTDSNGRFHSDWLSMMYERLFVARDLLKDDGVIFISIDDNEVHNLRKICDEIFGEGNFIEEFIWDKKNSAKGVPPKNMVVNIHEYILCYGKSQNTKLLGEIRTIDTFSNPDNDTRGLWRKSNIKSTIQREKDKFTIYDPETGLSFTNYWAFSENSLNKMIEEKRILFPKTEEGLPKQKEFFNEFNNPYIPIMSNFGRFDAQDKTEKEVDSIMQNKVFLYKKPINLMKKIISQAGNEEDITILDFFSGSATTAHAVMQLNAQDGGNRKFIMVQIPEKTDDKDFPTICEIGKERIRRAGKKILNDKFLMLNEKDNSKSNIENSTLNLDIGFRVLKVDSSNMKDIYYHPNEIKQNQLKIFETNIKEDRSNLDLLFSIMLDLGITLDLKITTKTVDDKKLYIIENSELVVCFENSISLEVIEFIKKEKPLKVVLKDACFENDTQKINAINELSLISNISVI